MAAAVLPKKPGEPENWPLKRAEYYAHPEGEDLLTKVMATNRYAFMIGGLIGSYDIVMYSKHLKGFQPNMGRVLYWVLPFVGMANAYTFTTYALTRARGKDDNWNCAAGGYMAGGIVGIWQKNKAMGWMFGTIFAIASTVKKETNKRGYEFFPDTWWMQGHGDWRRVAHDWTITREGERGWIAGTYSGEPPKSS